MEVWHRGWWFKLLPQLPVCFGFTIVPSLEVAKLILLYKIWYFPIDCIKGTKISYNDWDWLLIYEEFV